MNQLLSEISGVPLHLDDQAGNICAAFKYSEYAEARDAGKCGEMHHSETKTFGHGAILLSTLFSSLWASMVRVAAPDLH